MARPAGERISPGPPSALPGLEGATGEGNPAAGQSGGVPQGHTSGAGQARSRVAAPASPCIALMREQG